MLEVLDDDAVAQIVQDYEGSDIENAAKSWYAEGAKQWSTKLTWEELGPFAKFTWLSFAERRLTRSS